VSVANPNVSFAGRLVMTPRSIIWTSRRGGHLGWDHADVPNVGLRRVRSFRLLGYLTITSTDGRSFEARIFQPREITDALQACGYPLHE